MNPIQDYILDFVRMDNEQLSIVAEQQYGRTDIQPSIGPEVGKFVSLLVRSMNAKKVLEIGTCLGYSTVWFGQSVKETGGKLISIEYNEGLYQETHKNVTSAGLEPYVDLRLGDARSIVKTLDGPFDVIVQDSDKRIYPEMLEDCIQLVRLHGIIIADDTLFKPMGIPEELSKHMDEYNHMVFQDPRLYSTILPIGDGITISVKMKE